MQNTVDHPIAKSAQYMIRIEMTLFLVLSLSLINCDHGQGVFHLCASKDGMDLVPFYIPRREVNSLQTVDV